MNHLLRKALDRLWSGLIKKSVQWSYVYLQHSQIKKTMQWLIQVAEYCLLIADPSNTYACLGHQQWRFELLFNLIGSHFFKSSVDEKNTTLLDQGDLHV